MSVWSPTTAYLPVTGEKPISSTKWKNTTNEIYTYLNYLHANFAGTAAPSDAEVGTTFYDTDDNGFFVNANSGWLQLAYKTYVDAFFNTSTGHDHDGTDSKKITASNVVNTPAGNIAATNVQAAITELDTEKIAKAIGTAKGDLIGFSASNTPVRVAVGANNNILVADSSASAGVAYKSAATLGLATTSALAEKASLTDVIVFAIALS
jgi:hypothetical protein